MKICIVFSPFAEKKMQKSPEVVNSKPFVVEKAVETVDNFMQSRLWKTFFGRRHKAIACAKNCKVYRNLHEKEPV